MDFVKIAEGMGVPARRVTTAEELADALAAALAEPGPHLIEAVVPSLLGQKARRDRRNGLTAPIFPAETYVWAWGCHCAARAARFSATSSCQYSLALVVSTSNSNRSVISGGDVGHVDVELLVPAAQLVDRPVLLAQQRVLRPAPCSSRCARPARKPSPNISVYSLARCLSAVSSSSPRALDLQAVLQHERVVAVGMWQLIRTTSGRSPCSRS